MKRHLTKTTLCYTGSSSDWDNGFWLRFSKSFSRSTMLPLIFLASPMLQGLFTGVPRLFSSFVSNAFRKFLNTFPSFCEIGTGARPARGPVPGYSKAIWCHPAGAIRQSSRMPNLVGNLARSYPAIWRKAPSGGRPNPAEGPIRWNREVEGSECALPLQTQSGGPIHPAIRPHPVKGAIRRVEALLSPPHPVNGTIRPHVAAWTFGYPVCFYWTIFSNKYENG